MNALRTLLSLAGLASALALAPAHAQQYPTKPIRMVVGYAAGGVADITARLMAQKLSTALGQQVLVDNRPSAGGIIAGDLVAKSDPDGYTLLHMNYGNAVSVALLKSIPYDIEKDFAPISPMGFFDIFILANKGSSIASLKDLIAAVKNSPQKTNVGTVSIGSGQNMAAELFRAVTGLPMTIVTFKATPALITALKGNEIQAAFEIGAPVMSLVKSGDLKVLAITGGKRFHALPDVPTVMESGVPNYNVSAWNGVAAPAKTPRPIIERLNREINAALALPDIRQKFEDLGIDARGGSPQDLAKLLSSEIAKWTRLAAEAGIEKQ